MKKRLLALVLAMAMVLGMSMTVSADEPTDSATYEDMSTIIIKKTYNETNDGTTSPAETFTFTELTCTGVEDGGVLADGTVVNATNAPVPTIKSVSYEAGEAGSDTKTKEIEITLPTYTAVGVYTYTFSEITPDVPTAGVTYNDDTFTLVVTVIEQDGKVRVAAVHTENPAVPSYEDASAKKDEFVNVYSAGSLTVEKVVEGLFGDKAKDFTVTVAFTAPAGKIVNEDITFTDGTENSIEGGWTTSKSVDITLKHGESVTFTNIPYGVTYTVEEADYTGEGYEAAAYDFSDDAQTIDTASDNVTITNVKDGDIDTGIFTTNMPYILALVAIAAVAVVMFRRKREF